MFTFGDIRNIAVQIEKNGETTYRNAGRAAQNPQIAAMLNWMADEEQRHARWFASLQSDKILTEEQQEIEAMGRTLLQDMIKGNPFLLDEQELENAQDIQELLTRSITFEEDTVLFYEFLVGFIDDEETIGQLKRIIEEERGHIQKLGELEASENPDNTEPLSCEEKNS